MKKLTQELRERAEEFNTAKENLKIEIHEGTINGEPVVDMSIFSKNLVAAMDDRTVWEHPKTFTAHTDHDIEMLLKHIGRIWNITQNKASKKTLKVRTDGKVEIFEASHVIIIQKMFENEDVSNLSIDDIREKLGFYVSLIKIVFQPHDEEYSVNRYGTHIEVSRVKDDSRLLVVGLSQ